MKLKLTKPLVFFDLETTGTSVTKDRIVEISMIKVMPDGEERVRTLRINPQMHIPAEASAVHHITDQDVADEPTFGDVAAELAECFKDCDIAGFNSNRFDLPLLCEEFARAGVPFDRTSARMVDVQTIFHKKEQRTLVAAYRFYCDRDLLAAHSANADTRATYEVLMAQLDKYPDLPNDIQALADYSSQNRSVDLMGRVIKDENGNERINFGKNKGQLMSQLDQSYIDWVLAGDFAEDTKQVFARYKKEQPKHKK